MTDADTALDQQQVAQMLEWLGQGPALMRAPEGVIAASELLTDRPDPECRATMAAQVLDEYLAGADRRLGRLFELLCRALLAHQPHLQLMAHNLVIANGRTLGELDLLVRDQRDGALCHVEMTLKFYLGVAPGYWPGPNARDRLSRKWQHMAQHQFPLAHQPAARATLAAHGFADVTRQYLLSRGRLFYPASASLAAPAEAAPGHAHGRWFRAAQLPADSHWQLVTRQLWMLAHTLYDKPGLRLASHQVFDYVQQRTRPLMVIHHPHGGTPDIAFVVPDQGWPNDNG